MDTNSPSPERGNSKPEKSRRETFAKANPIWVLFTIIYGIAIASNFGGFVGHLVYRPVTDITALWGPLLFFVSMIVIIADWFWSNLVYADYPPGFNYYASFADIRSTGKIIIVLLHVGFIFCYATSFSLIPRWAWESQLWLDPQLDYYRTWDNPIGWFLLSMWFSNLWDISGYCCKLFRFTWRSLYWFLYVLSMWGIVIVLTLWFLGLKSIGSVNFAQQQKCVFISVLMLVLIWRLVSIRLANPEVESTSTTEVKEQEGDQGQSGKGSGKGTRQHQ